MQVVASEYGLILIMNSMFLITFPFLSHGSTSQFLLKLKGTKKDIIVGNCYRPNSAPHANIDKAIEFHSSIISKLKTEYKNCPIVLLGDLNIDLLQFSTHNNTNQYLESLLSSGFLPIITFPTRIHKRSATLIDHVFTNNKSTIYEAGILTTPLSDHFPVYYIEETKIKNQGPRTVKTRKFTDESIKSYCDLLSSTSWNGIVTDNNPATAFNNFFDIINEARDIAFPEVEVKQKQNKVSHSPWMSQGLLCSQKN